MIARLNGYELGFLQGSGLLCLALYRLRLRDFGPPCCSTSSEQPM